MKKIAATVPKLDIVGIKLGMTPEEVTAVRFRRECQYPGENQSEHYRQSGALPDQV